MKRQRPLQRNCPRVGNRFARKQAKNKCFSDEQGLANSHHRAEDEQAFPLDRSKYSVRVKTRWTKTPQ